MTKHIAELIESIQQLATYCVDLSVTECKEAIINRARRRKIIQVYISQVDIELNEAKRVLQVKFIPRKMPAPHSNFINIRTCQSMSTEHGSIIEIFETTEINLSPLAIPAKSLKLA